MPIRRRCSRRRCKNGRRCLEHLELDVTHARVRYRMHINEFAIPRMEAGKQRPIRSMEEAKHWERVFIGEIKAGRDPRCAPPVVVADSTPQEAPAPEPTPQLIAGLLDAYFTNHVKPSKLRSIASVESRIAVLKEHLGELPVNRLEQPNDINRFKSDSEYASEVTISTLNKVLTTLRTAINWGMAQEPPWLERSPFHRFGVRLNRKAETKRDRRIPRDEEWRLLNATASRPTTWVARRSTSYPPFKRCPPIRIKPGRTAVRCRLT